MHGFEHSKCHLLPVKDIITEQYVHRSRRLLCHDARKYVRNRVRKSEKNRHA